MCRPATVDGYAIHYTLDIIRRCWAHIIRDAKARAVEKAGVGQTDCRDARILLERLKYIRHIAKAGPRDQACYDAYVRKAIHIAKQYTTKFSKTLAKAAPNLFTFVLYNMEPTYTPR